MGNLIEIVYQSRVRMSYNVFEISIRLNSSIVSNVDKCDYALITIMFIVRNLLLGCINWFIIGMLCYPSMTLKNL